MQHYRRQAAPWLFDLTADDAKIDSVCNYTQCKSIVISGPAEDDSSSESPDATLQ
jgi:hypothetical protein